MDRQVELLLMKRLRQEGYKTREARLETVKAGGISTVDAASLTQEELEFLLPGRKIEWVINVARFTDHPDRPIWLEQEALIDRSSKRLIVDRVGGIITFQDDGCSTRTVRISSIFTLTIRVMPLKIRAPKPVPRHLQKKMNRKKLAVA